MFDIVCMVGEILPFRRPSYTTCIQTIPTGTIGMIISYHMTCHDHVI